MSYQLVSIGDLTKIRTGKLDANAASADGRYPFFTCSKKPLKIDNYAYDCDAILIAGNGDLNVKHFKGKFEAYQRTYIIEVVQHEKLDSRYLFHFMDKYVEKLRALSIGGVIKYIKLGMLTEAKIPLPPLPEQRRIAAILDKVDAIRRKRQQAIRLTEEFLRSVFLDMFGDPVLNPKGWEVGELGDLIHSAKDGPHVSPKYSANGIPFLSTRHIKPGKIVWADLKYLSRKEAEVQWRKCKPEKGDILYTKGGTTGIASAFNEDTEIAVWVHVALLKTNHEVADAIWLENMLNTNFCYRQSQKFTHGITNKDLGLKRMVKIKMYTPPLIEQKKFSDLVSKIRRWETNMVDFGSRNEDLFNSLVQRAFRGEL